MTRRYRYTYAQVGDAVEPDGHVATYSDVTDDEIATPTNPTDLVDSEEWAYRMRQTAAPYENTAPASGDAGEDTTAVHGRPGAPDLRRQADTIRQAGYPQHPAEGNRGPERLTSGPVTPRVPGSIVLDRPRAGSTSLDPAREQRMSVWLFDRPFDQWSAYGTPVIDHIEERAGARMPIVQTEPTRGGIPSPGGVAGTTHVTAYGQDRNTVRIMPRPWDESLTVDTEGGLPGRRWGL